MAITFRASTPSDRAGILEVLDAARGAGLSADQRAERGFIQGRFNDGILARIESGPGIVVGLERSRVVAVAATMTRTSAGGPPASLAAYLNLNPPM